VIEKRGIMHVRMFAPGLLCIIASRLSAQDTADLLNRIKAMEARIQALERMFTLTN
jgi:hypothetical protein